jgi:hypothetical protein
MASYAVTRRPLRLPRMLPRRGGRRRGRAAQVVGGVGSVGAGMPFCWKQGTFGFVWQ